MSAQAPNTARELVLYTGAAPESNKGDEIVGIQVMEGVLSPESTSPVDLNLEKIFGPGATKLCIQLEGGIEKSGEKEEKSCPDSLSTETQSVKRSRGEEQSSLGVLGHSEFKEVVPSSSRIEPKKLKMEEDTRPPAGESDFEGNSSHVEREANDGEEQTELDCQHKDAPVQI